MHHFDCRNIVAIVNPIFAMGNILDSVECAFHQIVSVGKTLNISVNFRQRLLSETIVELSSLLDAAVYFNISILALINKIYFRRLDVVHSGKFCTLYTSHCLLCLSCKEP